MSDPPTCLWCDRPFQAAAMEGSGKCSTAPPAAVPSTRQHGPGCSPGLPPGTSPSRMSGMGLRQRARCLEARSRPRSSRRRRRSRNGSPKISAGCSMRWMRFWRNRQSRCWSGYVGSRPDGRRITPRSCMVCVALSGTCSTWRAMGGLRENRGPRLSQARPSRPGPTAEASG